jgi:flavodoxin I
MKKTVIIYGTSTGTCEDLASRIGAKLGVDNIINVTDLDENVIAENDNLILGTSTWGAGEMQDDWYDGIKVIKSTDLSGKTVALFGCGDSGSYPDTFVGGMAEIYNAVKTAGANVIGAVSTEGYTFDDSESVVDGKFVGLALDEVNEDDKTDERINAWVEEIQPNL